MNLTWAGSPVDTLEDLLLSRRSCRQFLARPVERPVIERMLGLAQRSPSWCNTQPWRLEITEGKATTQVRELLQAHAHEPPRPDLPFPERYTGIHQQRRRDCGQMLYDSIGIPPADRDASTRQALRNFDLFDAPHFALLTTARDLGTYGVLDCGLYLATLLLAAESLSLAAIPQAAVAGMAPALRQHFKLAEDRAVVCGISFGYPDTGHPINGFWTTRADLEQVVTWRS